MIVCICNNVNSDTITEAMESGANTLHHIREQTGASACCGKCQFKVNRMLNDFEQTDVMASVCSGEG